MYLRSRRRSVRGVRVVVRESRELVVLSSRAATGRVAWASGPEVVAAGVRADAFAGLTPRRAPRTAWRALVPEFVHGGASRAVVAAWTARSVRPGRAGSALPLALSPLLLGVLLAHPGLEVVAHDSSRGGAAAWRIAGDARMPSRRVEEFRSG